MLLHKYCGVSEYTLKSIQDEKAFFATRDLLNDPFDCMPRAEYNLSEEEIDELYEYASVPLSGYESYESKLEALKGVAGSFLGLVGIYCVTTNAKSELMWAHYADNHRGIAIGCRINPLEIVSIDQTHHIPQKVIYSGRGVISGSDFLELARDSNGVSKLNDHDYNGVRSRLVNALYLNKNPAWRYEREYRFVSHIATGVRDFGASIECITYGLRVNEEARGEIRLHFPHYVTEYEIVLGQKRLERRRCS